LLQYGVTVVVYPQVGFEKIDRLHSQTLGYTLDVFIDPQRSGGFAALRTIQAIDFGKRLPMRRVHHGV
jgi:hypothetical protein